MAYIDEAEKMTSAMLREMTRVLEESQCADKLEAVTQGHGFISFGSLVCAQVDQRTPRMHFRTCSGSFSPDMFYSDEKHWTQHVQGKYVQKNKVLPSHTLLWKLSSPCVIYLVFSLFLGLLPSVFLLPPHGQ